MGSSMTGYGRGEAADADRRVTVEVKSINNRYCDLQIRMPRIMASLEGQVREMTGKRINRGKVDLFINYEDTSPESSRVACDVGLARAYAKALREIAASAEVPEGLNAAVIGRFTDVLRVESAVVEPERIWSLLAPALEEALSGLCRMRSLEGGRLVADVLLRADALEENRKLVAERAPGVILDYRQKLTDRINDLLGERAGELFDDQRMAAEVALYADKCAIDEELVRLQSHISQLKAVVQLHEPMGKKLDFIVQEMNREINTIGSKANDLVLVNLVVAMKSDVEKIREQIQNLE